MLLLYMLKEGGKKKKRKFKLSFFSLFTSKTTRWFCLRSFKEKKIAFSLFWNYLHRSWEEG